MPWAGLFPSPLSTLQSSLCVFPTFIFQRGLGRIHAELLGAQRLSVWSWACPAPPSLPSFPAHVSFSDAICHFLFLSPRFHLLTSCLLHFHYENIYCLLSAAEPKRTLQLHFSSCTIFFCFSSFHSPLKCFATRCRMGSGLLAHGCGPGFTWGRSSGAL